MKFLSLPIAILLLPIAFLAQPRPADLVVINAKVRTMTAKGSVAEAVAVSGNRITAVGTNRQIQKLIGPATNVIDARGRLVLPGFNDAHVHFMAIGNSFSSIGLRDAKTSGEIEARVRRFAQFLPKGRWILGSGWNEAAAENLDLDAAAPLNPVFVYDARGQAAIVNSLALRLAGVSNSENLRIVRGNALAKIAAAVPKDHTRNWLELAETATNYAASLGVTSVQDMHSDDSRAVYLELERQGKLKTRVYDCLPLRDRMKLASSRIERGSGAMVSDGCLKSFSDGDEADAARLLQDVVAADNARLQVMIHAIGKSANKIVLGVFEQAARMNGRRDRRFRVEHAHDADQADLYRFGKAKVIASMQPFLFEGSSGSDYAAHLKQNAPVAFGSDASMVDLNPLLGIHAAVTGSEPVSLYEAVRAYTVGSAYAEFQEKEKGTIEAGRLADFVILSDDIFTIDPATIRNVTVAVTIIGGKVVYRSN